MGGDEVLEDVQAFHEVSLDRTLDDLALRIGHQSAHTRQLADLLERTTGTRVGHHVDGVRFREPVLDLLTDCIGGLVPELNHLAVTLLLRDQTIVVLLTRNLNALLVVLEDFLLLRRCDDVVLRDRNTRLRGVLEAEVLDRVKHHRDLRGAVAVDERGHEVRDLALRQGRRDLFDVVLVKLAAELHLQREAKLVVEDCAARRGDLANATLAAQDDCALQRNPLVIESDLHLFGRGKRAMRAEVLAGRTLVELGL